MKIKSLTFIAVLFGIIAGIFLIVFLGPSISRQKISYWACRLAFERYLHRDRFELEKQSRSGEAGVYYFTSYYLHGMISAIEATQNQRLLKKTIYYMDNMVDRAVPYDLRGNHYEVWGAFQILPNSPVPKPNAHYTLQAAVPLARLAALILKTPAYRAKYEDNAKRYIQFVKSAVFDFWYRDEYGNKVPWLDVENVPIWNDNATNIGLCALFMYEATGDDYYGDIAKTVGKAFQSKLSISGRGWIWESGTIPIGSDTDNTPGSVGNLAGVPDTSHTNREPMMMVFLHEAGLLFDREDIERMSFTFLDNIWNQSLKEPSFANYINGSNLPYRVYKEPGLNGPIYHGWAFIGGYSAEVQKVLWYTLKAIVRGRENPSLDRNSTGYGGMLGLTGHLLRNFSHRQSTRVPSSSGSPIK